MKSRHKRAKRAARVFRARFRRALFAWAAPPLVLASNVLKGLYAFDATTLETFERAPIFKMIRVERDPFREAREANSLEPVAHIIKEGYEYFDRLNARNQARTGEQIFLDALDANLSPAETAERVLVDCYREEILFGCVLFDGDVERLRSVSDARDDYAEIVRELQRRGGITTPGAVRDGSAAIRAFWSVGP